MEMEREKKPHFDLMVTHRDPQTGAVIGKNPYTIRVLKAADGGKTKVFERPPGSGNIFNSKGEPIGRWDASLPEGKRFLKDEEHIAFKVPESQDQKLIRESVEKDAKIEALKRELDAIKAEKVKADQPKKQADQAKKGS